MDDNELLREYVRSQSQDAFSELVGRHLPMVYSAARRILQDNHLAEDVAQRVFTVLAKKSDTLGTSSALAGWLYNTTRYLAMHAVRTEQRRRQREQSAVVVQSLQSPEDTTLILDELEPAMAELEDSERDVLVLRFFEGRSLREVGQELGIGEDAARMRVNRAIERLRTVFAQHGITVSSVLLITAVTTGTTTAVPAGLAATITATTLTAAAAAIATPAFLTNMINAKALIAIISAAVLAGTTTYLVQNRKLEPLRVENQNLQAQEQRLRAELETVRRTAQAAGEQLVRSQRDNAELLRLRSEVAQLRQERQTVKQGSTPTASTGQSFTNTNTGRYITKEQLAFAGYATPEAALQSTTWLMMKGTYEQNLTSFTTDVQQNLLADPQDREHFNATQPEAASLFRGLQILAKKTLAENMVEFKFRMDSDSAPGMRAPPLLIQPMVKVGNEWKIHRSTRNYGKGWDQEGQIEVLAQ